MGYQRKIREDDTLTYRVSVETQTCAEIAKVSSTNCTFCLLGLKNELLRYFFPAH